MFSPSLRPSLVALVALVAAAYSVPSVPPPNLTVKTWTSDLNVDGLENLKVTTTVVNTGGESLKLLNDPRGVLDPFPEDSFTFANPSGSHPSFVGARASYNSTLAAGLNDPTAFTVLAPGGSVNVTHDLSAAYDFTRSGTGEYSIEPSNLFTYIDADGIHKALYATVGDIAKVKLSGDLGVSGRVHNKRGPEFPGCEPWQVEDLQFAINQVPGRTAEAIDHHDQVRSQNTVTPRYRRWFGAFHHRYWIDIGIALSWISEPDLFSRVTFTCLPATPRDATGLIYSEHSVNHLYVLPRAFTLGSYDELLVYVVHQAVHQAERRAARVVAEAARADLRAPHRAPHVARDQAARMVNLRIDDEGTGIWKCMDYANHYPGIARRNAENYAHFIVNRRGE